MALGLIRPSGGAVELLGEPVGATHEGVLRRVGALIEEPGFWKYLSGRQNLDYFARAAGPPADRAERMGRVDEVLHTVGLQDAAAKKVKAYSQGMRQRLGIALALLGQARGPDAGRTDERPGPVGDAGGSAADAAAGG